MIADFSYTFCVSCDVWIVLMLSKHMWGGGRWLVSIYSSDRLCLTWDQRDHKDQGGSEDSDSLSWQKLLLVVVREEEGANRRVPSVWLMLSAPWLLYQHWSTRAEIHLSGSPPMGAQCWPGECWRPMGGPDPPGLPPVCLSGSWLSSHLTVSRCQHYWNIFNQKLKYFSN